MSRVSRWFRLDWPGSLGDCCVCIAPNPPWFNRTRWDVPLYCLPTQPCAACVAIVLRIRKK
eukprot:11004147-Prorocentrum_lima.AAC.1